MKNLTDFRKTVETGVDPRLVKSVPKLLHIVYLSIEIFHLSAKISKLSLKLSHMILDWKELLHIRLIME